MILVPLCVYNIWNASGNVAHPLLKHINVPFKNIAFSKFGYSVCIFGQILTYLLLDLAPGPLLTTLRKVLVFLRTEIYAPSKPAQPVATPPPVAPLQNLKDDVKFTSLFLKDTTPKQQQPTNIPGVKTPSAGPLAPNHSIPTIFNATSTKPKIDEMEISGAVLQYNGQAKPAKPAASLTSSGIPVTKQQTFPTLKHTPCIQPPLQPTSHRERLLWFLSPTPEIVDDFRIEQVKTGIPFGED